MPPLRPAWPDRPGNLRGCRHVGSYDRPAGPTAAEVRRVAGKLAEKVHNSRGEGLNASAERS